MTIIATDTDQIVLCVRQKMPAGIYGHKTEWFWSGAVEVERKEYTAKDILHLADYKPEDIVKVWRIDVGSGACEDVTDLVLEVADE